MATIDTEVLVVGSGAGGAATAATLAAAGRDVTVVEEGPWVDPDAVEPFSLEEMVREVPPPRLVGRARHARRSPTPRGGASAAAPRSTAGCGTACPADLADEWRARLRHRRVRRPRPSTATRQRVEDVAVGVSRLPAAPPLSSALLERGATKLGWRSVEFPRVFRYDAPGTRREADDGAHADPARGRRRRDRAARTAASGKLLRRDGRAVGVHVRAAPDGRRADDLTISADHVFVCGGAIQTPALLQRSGFRRRDRRAASSCTRRSRSRPASRTRSTTAASDAPHHRVRARTSPSAARPAGGATSRWRSPTATADFDDALADWEHVVVYYAAIRSDGGGRVLAVPGLKAPVVTYRLTDGDLSRLARGLVHLGEVLLAAGATELYPSVVGGAGRASTSTSWRRGGTRSTARAPTS